MGRILALIAAVGALFGGKAWLDRDAASLRLINLAPYTIWCVVSHPVDETTTRTAGWVRLAPGEQYTLDITFLRVEPAFYVGARSDENYLIRRIHAVKPGEEARVYWEGQDVQRQVVQGSMDATLDAALLGSFTFGLERAKPMESGSDEFVHAFVDPLFPHLNPEVKDGVVSRDALAAAMHEVPLLAESLQRQVAHDAQWGRSQYFPFHLGARIVDANGFGQLGVEVEDAWTHTTSGDPMRLLKGDRIIQFQGRPVYGVGDIWALVFEHATDKNRGIEKPLQFVVERNGELVSDITVYFFDRNYFAVNDTDKVVSAWLGFTHALSFGNSPVVNAVGVKGIAAVANVFQWAAGKLNKEYQPKYVETPSYADLRWGFAQKTAMMKQFESASFTTGALGGIIFQPSRPIVARIFGRTGRALAGSAVGRMGLEIAETSLWTLMDGSPMRTPAQLSDDLSDALPLALLAGFVQVAAPRVR